MQSCAKTKGVVVKLTHVSDPPHARPQQRREIRQVRTPLRIHRHIDRVARGAIAELRRCADNATEERGELLRGWERRALVFAALEVERHTRHSRELAAEQTEHLAPKCLTAATQRRGKRRHISAALDHHLNRDHAALRGGGDRREAKVWLSPAVRVGRGDDAEGTVCLGTQAAVDEELGRRELRAHVPHLLLQGGEGKRLPAHTDAAGLLLLFGRASAAR
jgi:hypothetical protein